MAATCQIDEYNTVGESETSNISNLNFGSNDSANLSVSSYPINAGENSYEKWIKMSFTGTFNTVDNLKVWKSAGAYVTGEGIDTNLKESSYSAASFSTPTDSTSSVAVEVMPTTEPSGANIGISGSLSGQLTSAGDSDYIVMQLQTTGSTPAGDVNEKTFTFQWDET